ncbi:MAG: hypothetical protein LBF50_03465 [Azoarcus sp.]|jgi:ABC-type phosphate transport system permease subunit|nr:hypothetical protein [Azoarcus sp.]
MDSMKARADYPLVLSGLLTGLLLATGHAGAAVACALAAMGGVWRRRSSTMLFPEEADSPPRTCVPRRQERFAAKTSTHAKAVL